MSFRFTFACDINGCKIISEERNSNMNPTKLPDGWIALRNPGEDSFTFESSPMHICPEHAKLFPSRKSQPQPQAKSS
jgi:hypothetical protein